MVASVISVENGASRSSYFQSAYLISGVIVLSAVLMPASSQVRGSKLCEHGKPERLSMCASLVNADTASRALYRFTRDRAVLLPAGTYNLADPATVTLVSQFESEINLYNQELSKLYQALVNYKLSDNYLFREQNNGNFVKFLKKLDRKLRDARNSVDDLVDALARMTLSDVQSKPASVSDATKPSGKTSLESTDSIQQKANYLTQTLKSLLRRWKNQCKACGDFRRKRSIFVSKVE